MSIDWNALAEKQREIVERLQERVATERNTPNMEVELAHAVATHAATLNAMASEAPQE